MPERRESALEVDGASLAYDVTDGAGPAVVALHGLGSSRVSEDASGFFDWTPLRARGRRLVRYDARGHGHSSGGPRADDYTWSRLADDLIALLDVVSPDAPVDAVGVSMGVGTLLHAVARRPERFRRLALVIPPTAGAARAAQADGYRAMAALAETQGRDALLAAMAAAPPLPLLAAGGWTSPPPDVGEDELAAVLRGAAATDIPDADVISGIDRPVLLLPWIGDPAHPLSTAEHLHELVPHAALQVIRTPDDLRALGDVIVQWLDGLDAPVGG